MKYEQRTSYIVWTWTYSPMFPNGKPFKFVGWRRWCAKVDSTQPMKRYTEDEYLHKAACLDCGLEYGSAGWLDVLVSDSVWEIINPTFNRGAGLLCVTCIARRCAEAGLDNVPMVVTGGVLTNGALSSIRPLTVTLRSH
jgi:hypothetical protein